ncbi:MAG: hypothetical protein IPK88_07515 [Saprospiraceae bacterium]|nr:hypothetical protein [Candidatus Defluviibacterium haderslevense]
MKHKIQQLFSKLKIYGSTSYSFYDLSELLHHPWHKHDLYLLLAIIIWFVLIKIAVIVFVQFEKVLPYVFSKSRCVFILWLLFISLTIITFSNLICNFLNGMSLQLLYIKSIITIVAMLIDWYETKNAINKYKKMVEK